jgi:cytochrome b involved in lipid metabolism
MVLWAQCLIMEYTTSPKDKSLASPPLQEPPTKIYALSEIAQHNRLDDIWVIIDGNVYDLTNFVSEHPGGGKSTYCLEMLGSNQKI